jgi:hypothetical protein
MTIRVGMTNLVQRLREAANADTGEFVLGGGTYWTSDQLQTQLDRQRQDIYGEPIPPTPTYVNGEAQYLDYYWRYSNVEEATSGSAAWLLRDSNGSAIGTGSYSIDYDARKISFPATTSGSVYNLTYRTFNVNLAAAEVWDIKAANVSRLFDVKTDNHDLKRSQLEAAYTRKAKEFRQKSGANVRVKQMFRGDLSG